MMQEVLVDEVRTPRSSITERTLAAAGASAMIAGAAAVWYFDPTKGGFFPVCPLYSMTGFACPGCGLTRGFHALFHGDVLTALDYNALLPIFALVVGAGFLSLVSLALRGRGLAVSGVHGRVLSAFLVLLLVFGVIRNIPVYPFSILFP